MGRAGIEPATLGLRVAQMASRPVSAMLTIPLPEPKRRTARAGGISRSRPAWLPPLLPRDVPSYAILYQDDEHARASLGRSVPFPRRPIGFDHSPASCDRRPVRHDAERK